MNIYKLLLSLFLFIISSIIYRYSRFSFAHNLNFGKDISNYKIIGIKFGLTLFSAIFYKLLNLEKNKKFILHDILINDMLIECIEIVFG